MNKILLNNFPYPTQHIGAKQMGGSAKPVSFIHGFETEEKPITEFRKRMASDLLQAILVHEVVSLELMDIYNLVLVFGFDDTIKLLQAGCFEIIDHRGFSSVLIQDGSKYRVDFVRDGSDTDEGRAYFNRLERNLKKAHPLKTAEVNLLMLQVEKHRNFFTLVDPEKVLTNEIDFDLQNRNLTTTNGIVSKNSKEIAPADVYKVLRLLFINKSLFLGNSLNAVAVKLDGVVKTLLQQKLSPLIQHGTTHDPIALFQNVLGEKKIPDFSGLYFSNILSIEDVLLFRDNIHGEKFRHWFLTTHYDSEKVHEILLSKNIPQSILTKWLRFLIPNAIGIVNAPVGIVAGAIDSFIIDKIVGGWHPNFFLDDVLKAEIDSRLNLHAAKSRRDLIKSRFPDVGRNDQCPCGSGKKFKRCCGEGL